MNAARDFLPQRRPADLRTFTFARAVFTMGHATYPDGRPAEVFLDCVCSDNGKALHTSAMASICRDSSIIVSIALQHGVPAETLRQAITRGDGGEPATVIGAALDELCGGDRPVPKTYPPQPVGRMVGADRGEHPDAP